MSGNYYVYRIGGSMPFVAHDTFEEARAEASRLASKQVGRFVILRGIFAYESKLTVESSPVKQCECGCKPKRQNRLESFL